MKISIHQSLKFSERPAPFAFAKMGKRPCVQTFGRDSHLSQTALRRVLEQVREEGIPDAFSQRTQSWQRSSAAGQSTPFGPLLQTLDMDGMPIPVQHPFAMLWAMCNSSHEFAKFMGAVLDRHSNKMSICLYSDDVSPSSQLDRADERTSLAIYWSILELGPQALSMEECWNELCVIRTELIGQIRGGIPHLLKGLLRYFFGTPNDLRRGVMFKLPHEDSPRLVFGTLRMMIQDEVAHKFSTDAKGHAGIKLCALCKNVVLHRCDRLPDPGGYLVSSASLDTPSFKQHTDRSIRATLQRIQEVHDEVAAGLSSVEDFKLLQQELGFGSNPDSFLLDAALDVGLVSILQFDWMHTYFVNGIFVWEFNAFMKDLRPFRKGHHCFHQYLQAWSWPKAMPSGKTLCKHVAVDDMQARDAHGSASDFLSVANVLEKYVKDVCAGCGISDDKIQCILACIHVVQLLQNVAHGVQPRELHDAIVSHLELHQRCRGVTMWKPKMHYALHLAGCLERQGMLLSCFVHERKHRVLKRKLIPHQNKASFEKSLLEEITVQHLHDMCAPIGVGLKEPRSAPKKMCEAVRLLNPLARLVRDAEISTAKIAKIHGRSIAMGDVVIYRCTATGDRLVGCVCFHFCIGSLVESCIAPWEVIGGTDHFLKCRVGDHAVVVASDTLYAPCVFSHAKVGGVATVTAPPNA